MNKLEGFTGIYEHIQVHQQNKERVLMTCSYTRHESLCGDFDDVMDMLGSGLTVALYDIDASKEKTFRGDQMKYPNPALGKIFGYHYERGDFVVYPWDGDFQVDVLYISTIFAFGEIAVRSRLSELVKKAKLVIIGGSGWDDYSRAPFRITDLPPSIKRVDHRMTYQLYKIPFSIARATDGCHKGCGFCLVWKKEGLKEKRMYRLDEIINPTYFQREPDGSRIAGSDHLILMDNNALANPFFFETIEEIKYYDVSVHWDQANDITLVTPEIAKALASVDYRGFSGRAGGKALYFAFDLLEKKYKDPFTGEMKTVDMRQAVREGVRILADAGIKPRHLNWYMLFEYNTTREEDLERFHLLNDLGCRVYAMRFRDLTGKIDVRGNGQTQAYDAKAFAAWVNGFGFRSTPNYYDFDRYINARRRSMDLPPVPMIARLKSKGLTDDEVRLVYQQAKVWEA